jgi:hypothetical protein
VFKAGSLTFVANHPHKNWSTNDAEYRFPVIKTSRGAEIMSRKRPDKTFEVYITDLWGQTFSFRHPTPKCGPKGLFVVVAWKRIGVALYLNGQLADSVSFPKGKEPPLR